MAPPDRNDPHHREPGARARNIVWHHGAVTPEARRKAFGHAGCTVWLTGLSGSGKSTVAVELESRLVARGVHAARLDGDNVRHGLCAGLGFSAEDRAENIRRVGEVAALFAESGAVCLCSFVSPYRADRDTARALHAARGLAFFEVFIDTPLDECERRDPKGLYKKARAGEIRGMTGLDDPYEPPESPELVLRTATESVDASAARIEDLLTGRGVLDEPR